MRKISFICLLLLFFANSFAATETWNVVPAKSFFKGNGTENSPYIITTDAEFALMASYMQDSTHKNCHYALETDIIINEGNAAQWGTTPPKYKWKPIGDSLNQASGILYGQGHTISGLYINSEKEDYQGLFGNLNGSIYNLNLVNSFVKGRNYVSALASRVTTIENIFVEAVVEGKNVVGGITAYPFIRISHAIFKGAVKGVNYVGGIYGYSEISYNTSRGAEYCDNYGTIIGQNNVGGISGELYIDVPAQVVDLYKLRNFGNVFGHNNVGGIIGLLNLDRNGSEYKKMFNFKYLRNMGEISGNDMVGGLMGVYYTGRSDDSSHAISYSYNAGRVRADSNAYPLFYHAKWHAGYENIPYSVHCYNLAEIYGPNLVVDRISPNLIDNYADSLGPEYVPDTGATKINRGYPILVEEDKNFRYLKGSGTPDNPFLIESLEDLIKLQKYSQNESLVNRFYYKQTADIDLKSIKNWTPMRFKAINYDGGKHKISNMRSYSKRGCAGFISISDSGMTIKNLELENVDVKGTISVGALLCTANNADVSGIKVSGKVVADKDSTTPSDAGGIVGYYMRGKLYDLENHADVYVDGDAGGIIGDASSYSTSSLVKVTNYGNIFATVHAGGIAADFDETISFARNYGKVNGLQSAGGIAASAGGVNRSFNRGDVFSYDHVAGVVGAAKKVEYVYNTGNIYGDTVYASGYTVGRPYYSHRDSVILKHAYNEKKPGVFGLAGKNVLSSDTFSLTQKEFLSKEIIEKMGDAFIFDENNENDGYPVLYMGFKGEGTPESPFLISNKEDLYRMRDYIGDDDFTNLFANRNFKITNNIIFDSTDTWYPVGNDYNRFSGVLDGGGHTISGLNMNMLSGKNSKVALFRYLKGTIKNLGIENSKFVADTAAAFVLQLEGGTLENCWSKDSKVNGTNVASGIVAFADGNFTINRVFNASHVSGGDNLISGIVARIILDGNSVFTNSFNTGKIEGPSYLKLNSLANFAYRFDASKITLKNLYTTDTTGNSVFNKKDFTSSIIENVFHLKSSDDDSTGVTEKYMKSKEFAERLGKEFTYDSLGVNDGYPILLSSKTAFNSKKGLFKIAENNPSIKISTESGMIQLEGLFANEQVTLADVKGRILWKGRAIGNSLAITIKVPGIYVIKTKSVARKVLVK